MTIALASRRTALTPPWVRDGLWRRARAVPSLDLRFADNKSLTDAVTGASLVTFTRASSGTYTDSAGVLQTAATDVPRFGHNPTTGESLGLLVEEARTNGIRNNTMVGAVAGTPGTNPNLWQYVTAQSNGLTQTIVGVGTENGITYIDYRFNGTTVASPSSIAFGIDITTAATAQTWTNSLHWKLAAGTATGVTAWQIGVIETTVGGLFVSGANYTQTAPSSAALITQRPAATRTLSGGVTVGGVQMTLTIAVSGNTAIDFTIRIGLPQMEQGAFATSPILTSTAAATRSADVASITGSNFSSWYNQTEGTMFASGDFVALGANNFSRVIGLGGVNAGTDEISFHTRVAVGVGDGSIFGAVTVNSSLEGNLDAPSGSPNLSSAYRSAIAYKTNDFGLSSNGLTPTTDTSGTLPTITQLIIMGSLRFQNRLSGHVRRLTYWPTRLATLQAISQP